MSGLRPASTQVILQRLAEIKQALNLPKVVRRTNPPGVAATQPVNTPQPQVTTPAPIQPKPFWQEAVKIANTPIITPNQPVNKPPLQVTTPAATQPKPVGLGLWLQWVLANTVVGGVGIYAGTSLTIHDVASFMPLIVSATLLGGMQWLILRRLFSCKWWVLVTIVGVTIGYAMGFAVSSVVGFAVRYAVNSLVGGTSLGMMQWLVLRRSLSYTGWWIVANAVGVASVFYIYSFFNYHYGSYIADAALVPSFAVFGMTTGGALVWLIRQPTAKP